MTQAYMVGAVLGMGRGSVYLICILFIYVFGFTFFFFFMFTVFPSKARKDHWGTLFFYNLLFRTWVPTATVVALVRGKISPVSVTLGLCWY